METLKVGLIGLGRGGQRICDALMASSWTELIAVASPKSKRLEQFTQEHPDILAYDDFRSLVVENQSRLDVLFVAIPPFKRGPYLSLAAERNIAVWMLTPAARRFDEALEWADKFEQAECPIVVSRIWGCEPALQPETLDLEKIGRFFFARANVMTCWSEDLDWRGDSHRAGGGVFLDRAYTVIDTVVQLVGLPTKVYMAGAGVSRPGGHFPYDTEDTAAVICQFDEGAIASVSACWTSGPERWELELYGTNSMIHIDNQRVEFRDRDGEKQTGLQQRAENPFLNQIEEFLAELQSNPKNIRSTLRQHLATVATIQAAYLSARTGQPESPNAIFEMHDVSENPNSHRLEY